MYQCKLQEYNPDNSTEVSTTFQVITRKKEITLKAATELEMHNWLNNLLKHKLVAEQMIDLVIPSVEKNVVSSNK